MYTNLCCDIDSVDMGGYLQTNAGEFPWSECPVLETGDKVTVPISKSSSVRT